MDEQEIVSAFQDVEMTLIKSMRNTMRRHCREEYDENLNWTQWQAEMLKGLDEYKKSSAEVLPGYFSTINDEITGAIRDAHAQGGMEQEVEILRAIRDGYDAPSKPSTKRTTQGSFFSVNDKKLNALIKATNSDMKKAETAVLRMANDTYRKTMFKAQMHYNAGATNMWQAVDMATKDFLNQGINCIQYANGARVNIASYAEMALRTSNKRANLMGQAKKRDEWGIHTVIVSAHGGCCPRCMQWQGNVYIDDVHGAGNAKEAKATGYPLLSKAVAGGLLHPMCKHGVSTYYEGINSKPKTPTKGEKDESLRKYSLEQKQRYYERNYRRNMRLANGTQDEATAAMYRGRAGAYKKSLQELCAANPDVLRLDRQRISLRGVLSVDNAGAISVVPPTETALAKSVGETHYKALRAKVDNCSDDRVRKLWDMYEDAFEVNAKHRGKAYCLDNKLYVDIEQAAKGRTTAKPYQVVFHEGGHAIDNEAVKNLNTNGKYARHFSSSYKDGIFPQTIEKEVAGLVSAYEKELKAGFKEHAGDAEWFYQYGLITDEMYKAGRTFPTYRKSYAYRALSHELKSYDPKEVGRLCDIVEGATKGNVSCVCGHGKAYWKNRTIDGVQHGLATEAFAEMIECSIANTENIELIKQKLPESYKIFEEMLGVILENGR